MSARTSFRNSTLVLDAQFGYRELGTMPPGHAQYVEQFGVVFAWSPDTCRYEKAWWLYINRNSVGAAKRAAADAALRCFPPPAEALRLARVRRR